MILQATSDESGRFPIRTLISTFSATRSHHPVRDKELDGQARIPLQKRRQGWSDMVAYQHRRGVHTQMSARGRAPRSELRLGGFDRRQDFRDRFR